MRKFIIAWFFLTILVFSVYSENKLTEQDQIINLDSFYMLFSEFSEDSHYITGDINNLGFIRYDKGFLPVDENIKKRMYTFRTTFYISESLENEKLSIYIELMPYPRNLYLNGKLLFSTGKYKNDYHSDSFQSYNIQFTGDTINFGTTPNEFAIQIFPIFERNPLGKVRIGSYYKLSEMVFLRNFIVIHLVQATTILSFILFLYFLFLSVTERLKEKKYLYFAGLCLFFAFAYFNMSSSYDGNNILLVEKISRCSFPFAVLFLTFFITESTGLLRNNKLFKFIVTGIAFTLSVFTAFQSSIKEVTDFFNITMFFFIAPMLLCGIILLIISIVRHKSTQSLIILLSYLAIMLTAAHDIIYVTIGIIPYAYILQFGFLLMVISIFFLLAFEQSRLFNSSLKQTEDLDIKNKSLKYMMDNITEVVKKLLASSSQMQKVTSVSSAVIRQYEESNNEIIQTVLKRFEEIGALVKKITGRIENSAGKIPHAISNQTAVVEEVSATIKNMNTNIESTLVSANDSNVTAQFLMDAAQNSKGVINDSKSSVQLLSQYSQFLIDVLNALEDITDKTNILSINAAIEAARQGSHGKGFSVIAGEISGLSIQSQKTLESSFGKIKEMNQIIEKNIMLSNSIDKSLSDMILKVEESSEKTGNINNLIKEQKHAFYAILEAANSLLRDTMIIKELSTEEQKESEGVKLSLTEVKDTFFSINELLTRQLEKGKELYDFINNLEDITKENLELVGRLEKLKQ